MKEDINTKIVIGLERISEVFKNLLWEKAKRFGISPIQIQILLFIHNHKTTLCNVSQLAKEFDVSKATVSDAVKVLLSKYLLSKKSNLKDKRSYTLELSPDGLQLIAQLDDFSNPILHEIEKFNADDNLQLYHTLSLLIYQLNQKGILSVQRICYACKFYEQSDNQHYCKLLNKELKTDTIRIDCEEFEEN